MNTDENCSILVVDDEESVRKLIYRILLSKGYTVYMASGFDEAMEILRNRDFDILLTDHMMPGKKGLDLLIESNQLHPDMVKILFTGMGGQELYREAINKGAIFALIEKPFTNEQLCDILGRASEFRNKRLSEQKQFRELREQYRTIFDNTTDLIQCTDTSGKIIYVNAAWHKALGYSQEELSEITLFDIILERGKKEIQNIIEHVQSGRIAGAFETVMLSKKGSLIYLEGSATAQPRDEGVFAIIFIFRDVTERKRAEQEIKTRLKQEMIIARIAHQLANTEEPVFVYPSILEIVGELAHVDRTFIYSLDKEKNAFSCIDTWCTSPECLETQWEENVPINILPWTYDRIGRGKIISFSAVNTLPDSDRIFMEKHGVKSGLIIPIRAGIEIVGIIGFENLKRSKNWEENDISVLNAAVDIVANAWTRQMEINYRKQKEREAEQSRLLVIRADRLAALGTMTAGIIHEITQPLNAINVSTQTILYGLSRGWEMDDNKVKNSLSLIVDQIKRMNEIITNMRAFSRDGLPAAREIANLNVQVQRVFTMVGEQLKAHGIDFEIDLGDIPDNNMNTQQILQVILNLVTNARQALDDYDREEKKIVVATSLQNEHLVLTVSDNGPGIPGDILDKIFDPFFTTKEVGKGTGLGLSISTGIVNDHNGVLDVMNNDSGGATFHMHLPLT
ncbi:MAG: PAS domain S-box protein [Candidatus Latescibacteria bacterium]|nr:PAS domain S-box protein [Candidatus Latescibacterota bacterium]